MTREVVNPVSNIGIERILLKAITINFDILMVRTSNSEIVLYILDLERNPLSYDGNSIATRT